MGGIESVQSLEAGAERAGDTHAQSIVWKPPFALSPSKGRVPIICADTDAVMNKYTRTSISCQVGGPRG